MMVSQEHVTLECLIHPELMLKKNGFLEVFQRCFVLAFVTARVLCMIEVPLGLFVTLILLYCLYPFV